MEVNSALPWSLLLPDGRRLGGLRTDGEGTPLVMIHGLFDSAASWEEFMVDYPGPTWAVDVPGFQGSSPVPEPLIESYADQILAGLDAAGIERCRLVGHSLGGAIVSMMAASSPERFTDLTLIAPAGYGHITLAQFFDLPVINSLAASVLRSALKHPGLVGYTYSRAVAGGHHPDRGLLERISALGPFVSSGVRDAIHALAEAGSKRGLGLQEGFYSGPVICVWGDDDLLIPRSHIRNLRRVLPQAEIRVWMDISHHPQAEDPERMQRLLLEHKPSDSLAAEGSLADREPWWRRRLLSPAQV